MLATFGVIEGIISFVGVGDFLVNERIYPGILLVFALVVFASTPFSVPALWHAMKRPVKTDEQHSDLPKS